MILDSYEINSETLLLVPIDNSSTKVYEYAGDFVVNLSTLAIIKNSCLFFGSSYDGRKAGAKYITGIEMKVPIVIEDSRNIIFFPTSSCIHDNSVWISYQNLVRYNKINDNSTMLYFNRNRNIIVAIKYNLVDNQVIRCIKLSSLLERRKKFLETTYYNINNVGEI